MSQTKYLVKMEFSDSTHYNMLSQRYHPDYTFNKYDLRWNSGTGYLTHSCINAEGNVSFNERFRSFYVGNDYPSEASGLQSGLSASALVGMGIGCVDPSGSWRKTVPNLTTVQQGSSFVDYERQASVNDASLGYICPQGLNIRTTSISSSISWTYTTITWSAGVPSGFTRYPSIVAVVNDSNNAVFVGWFSNGTKVSSNLTYNPGNQDATGLEARFAPIPVLTYDTDGGSLIASQKAYGDITLASAPTKTGYAFVGWDIGGTVYSAGATYNLTEDATATAVWTGDKTVTTGYSLPAGAPLVDGSPQAPSVTYTMTGSQTGTEGKTVTATAQTSGLVGIVFSSWSVSGVAVQDQTANPLTFTMPDAAVSLVATYELKPLTVTHNVDDASEYATDGQTSAYIDYGGGEQGDITDAVYGDTAVFEAPAPRPDSNFTFDGWYDASGTRVATARTYTTVLSGDLALVAKYAIPVTIGKNEAADCKGEFSVNGTEYETQTAITLTRPLGSVLHVSATATSGYFGGWQVDGATNVSDIFAEDDIVVAAIRNGSAGAYTYVDSRSYVAQFVATAPEFTVLCESAKSNVQDAGNAGTLVVTGEGVTEGTGGAYTVSGFRAVTLVTSPDATSPLPLLDVVEVFGSYPTETEESIGDVRVVRVSKDRKFRAKWGTPAKYTVSVSAEANGMAYVGDLSGVTEQIVNQGDSVTVNAVPLNGYRFDGWYVGEQRIDAGSSHTFVPTANIALQARFTEDVAAIFLWEGSDAPKKLTWTSKVYATPRPFDPVAARVDAAGYPVDLTVRTYSSPDKADPLPVRDHALTSQNPLAVQSQDGRRLPRMRPERYLSVSVESYHEVDAVIVGTNMAEVN